MRVFISWSGDRSKAVALALSEWLPTVIQAVEPWFSANDLKSGSRWTLEIATSLEGVHFGIACMTPENLSSPWIHWEAGAVAKAVAKARLVPYLFDGIKKSDLPRPLGDFMAESADPEGTKRLVEAINDAQEKPLAKEVLEKTFAALWPNLKKALAAVPPAKEKNPPGRTPEDIAAETLDGVRRLAREVSELREAFRPGLTIFDHPRPLSSSGLLINTSPPPLVAPHLTVQGDHILFHEKPSPTSHIFGGPSSIPLKGTTTITPHGEDPPLPRD